MKNPPESKPALVLVLSREQAAALLAATSHYLTYAPRHSIPESREAFSSLQDIERELVEQARAPMLHPNCVRGIAYLMQLNRHILRHEPYDEEHMFAQSWLRTHNVPIYVDANAGIYRFGSSIGAEGVDR